MSNKQPAGSDGARPARRSRINATVVLVIGLPLFAIVASVGTAVVAVTRGDPVLPDQYHWEGDKLDHDFALSQLAARRHVSADLRLQPAQGSCRVDLSIDGAPPQELDLTLIHGSNASLDRQMRFLRNGASSSYTAQCAQIPSATWHVQLADGQNTWTFREDVIGDLDNVKLSFGTLAPAGTQGRVE